MWRTRTTEGETVVLVERTWAGMAWPAAFLTLGVHPLLGLRRFVVTDRRVIVTTGVLRRTALSVAIDRVHNATVGCHHWPGYRYVGLVSAGGGRLRIDILGPLSRKAAEHLAGAVTEQARRASAHAASAP